LDKVNLAQISEYEPEAFNQVMFSIQIIDPLMPVTVIFNDVKISSVYEIEDFMLICPRLSKLELNNF